MSVGPRRPVVGVRHEGRGSVQEPFLGPSSPRVHPARGPYFLESPDPELRATEHKGQDASESKAWWRAPQACPALALVVWGILAAVQA